MNWKTIMKMKMEDMWPASVIGLLIKCIELSVHCSHGVVDFCAVQQFRRMSLFNQPSISGCLRGNNDHFIWVL